MKRHLLSFALFASLCIVPTMEAGFGKEIVKAAVETYETVKSPAINYAQQLLDAPVETIGGTGLIVMAAAGIIGLAGTGIYLFKPLGTGILNNHITLGDVGKASLGAICIGTAYCSAIAGKNAIADN